MVEERKGTERGVTQGEWESAVAESAELRLFLPKCLVVKASASRAEGPRFDSRLRSDFSGVESYQ